MQSRAPNYVLILSHNHQISAFDCFSTSKGASRPSHRSVRLDEQLQANLCNIQIYACLHCKINVSRRTLFETPPSSPFLQWSSNGSLRIISTAIFTSRDISWTHCYPAIKIIQILHKSKRGVFLHFPSEFQGQLTPKCQVLLNCPN